MRKASVERTTKETSIKVEINIDGTGQSNISTGIGFLLWNIGATKVNSYRLAVSNNLVIPIAIINSVLIFGESISLLLFFPGIILFYIAYRIT